MSEPTPFDRDDILEVLTALWDLQQEPDCWCGDLGEHSRACEAAQVVARKYKSLAYSPKATSSPAARPQEPTPTDKELAVLLPTLPLEERIETVIRKYIGGAVSAHYDGDTAAPVADARIAHYLMWKLRPWLTETRPPV